MLLDGFTLAEGSAVENFTVPSGTSFPTLASAGELFLLVGEISTELYVHVSGQWVKVQTGAGGTGDWDSLLNKPTTVGGFGITDAYTKTETDAKIALASGVRFVRYLSMPGTLELFTGVTRWYPPQNVTIVGIVASVNTPASGSNIQVTLKKNGTEVNTASIPASQNKGEKTILSTAATSTDYFTIDVTAIGSTTPGADLVVSIEYSYA